MSLLAFLDGNITLTEIGLAMITLAVVERILHRLPDHIVGPGGWLLDLESTEDDL